MKHTILFLMILLTACTAWGQQRVTVENGAAGWRLTVDGEPLFVKGMNWDYFPVGTNYAYSLWQQPDDVIKAALANEMPLLRKMGVNVIRQYNTVPPRWVQYIYEQYGIYTMINHSFGRYGLTVDGTDYAKTDYCLADVRAALLDEAEQFVRTYKDTPGVLFYLIGNENNYGLFWEGAETEDLPQASPSPSKRGESIPPSPDARCLYGLMDEAARRIKAVDGSRPVALCNGDLQFLDIIADSCRHIDILGVNSYRGPSFDVLFSDVQAAWGKPVVLTEFGADALNALTGREAQAEQAAILVSNWQEICLNAAGMGQAGNCIGGFTFQFSDGWWKSGQNTNLDVHDTHASWSNGGYAFDYVEGRNNMNEEWFGICAKGQPDRQGLYKLYPRKAYKALTRVHRIDPYWSTPEAVRRQFNSISNKYSK